MCACWACRREARDTSGGRSAQRRLRRGEHPGGALCACSRGGCDGLRVIACYHSGVARSQGRQSTHAPHNAPRSAPGHAHSVASPPPASRETICTGMRPRAPALLQQGAAARMQGRHARRRHHNTLHSRLARHTSTCTHYQNRPAARNARPETDRAQPHSRQTHTAPRGATRQRFQLPAVTECTTQCARLLRARALNWRQTWRPLRPCRLARLPAAPPRRLGPAAVPPPAV